MVIYITVIYAVIYGCAIYAGTMGSCFIGVLRSRAAWGVFTIIPHPPPVVSSAYTKRPYYIPSFSDSTTTI